MGKGEPVTVTDENGSTYKLVEECDRMINTFGEWVLLFVFMAIFVVGIIMFAEWEAKR